MKICSIVGTRPNFVKEYLINRELKRRGVHEILIHTGQHYDYEMSQAFFECFELPAPDYHLQIPNSGGDGLEFSGRAIQEIQFDMHVGQVANLRAIVNRAGPSGF